MDALTACDCPFQERCATFGDRLIDAARKGPAGLGCRQQSDAYRNQHCHSFRCQFLCAILSDMFSPGKASPG
jgi:hypothetical protein